MKSKCVILFTSQFEKIFSSIEEYKKWSVNRFTRITDYLLRLYRLIAGVGFKPTTSRL